MDRQADRYVLTFPADVSQCAAVATYTEFGVAAIIAQPGEPGDNQVTLFFLLSGGAGLTHAAGFNLLLVC